RLKTSLSYARHARLCPAARLRGGDADRLLHQGRGAASGDDPGREPADPPAGARARSNALRAARPPRAVDAGRRDAATVCRPHLHAGARRRARAGRQRLLALEDGLGMLGGGTGDGALIVRPFARDTMVAIVSREHPWAKRKAVTLKALGREPLILREPGSAGREPGSRRMRGS